MLIFTPQFDVFFIYYAHAYLFTLVLFVYLLLKRAPRKIGYQPIGLPSQNKEFTYLLTYLLTQLSLACVKSDQNPRCPLEHASDPWLPTECPAKALIRLRGCAG